MNISTPYHLAAMPALTGERTPPPDPAQALAGDAYVAAAHEEEPVEQLSLLRKMAVVGGLALAGLAAAPQAAQAQVAPPTSQSSSRANLRNQAGTSQAGDPLARSLGLTERGAARLQQDRELQAQVRGLSDMAREMYQSYSPAQKHMLFEALSGHTRVGFAVIDHQQAFVTGRALGRDAFPTIWTHLESTASKEGLSPSEAHQLKNHFLVMTTMQASERAALAALIHADMAP